MNMPVVSPDIKAVLKTSGRNKKKRRVQLAVIDACHLTQWPLGPRQS